MQDELIVMEWQGLPVVTQAKLELTTHGLLPNLGRPINNLAF